MFITCIHYTTTVSNSERYTKWGLTYETMLFGDFLRWVAGCCIRSARVPIWFHSSTTVLVLGSPPRLFQLGFFLALVLLSPFHPLKRLHDRLQLLLFSCLYHNQVTKHVNSYSNQLSNSIFHFIHSPHEKKNNTYSSQQSAQANMSISNCYSEREFGNNRDNVYNGLIVVKSLKINCWLARYNTLRVFNSTVQCAHGISIRPESRLGSVIFRHIKIHEDVLQ